MDKFNALAMMLWASFEEWLERPYKADSKEHSSHSTEYLQKAGSYLDRSK